MVSMTDKLIRQQDSYGFWVIAALLLCLPVVQVQAASLDLPDVLSNIQEDLPALWRLIIASSYLIGIACVMKAVLMLKQYGQGTIFMAASRNLRGPMIYMTVGVSILFSQQLINVTMNTVWGYDINSILSYPTDVSGKWQDVLKPVIQLVQVLGLFAFFRGWILITKFGTYGEAQAPPGTLTKAGMHILGGIMAINFSGTIDLIYNTFFG